MLIYIKNENINIFTHNGIFHLDEIFAIALYKIYINPNITITRTRKLEEIEDNENNIFIDVGGKYDGYKYFDHHQKNDENILIMEKKYNKKFSSCGLIFNFCKEKIQQKHNNSGLVRLSKIFEYLEEIVNDIDKLDNGITTKKGNYITMPELVSKIFIFKEEDFYKVLSATIKFLQLLVSGLYLTFNFYSKQSSKIENINLQKQILELYQFKDYNNLDKITEKLITEKGKFLSNSIESLNYKNFYYYDYINLLIDELGYNLNKKTEINELNNNILKIKEQIKKGDNIKGIPIIDFGCSGMKDIFYILGGFNYYIIEKKTEDGIEFIINTVPVELFSKTIKYIIKIKNIENGDRLKIGNLDIFLHNSAFVSFVSGKNRQEIIDFLINNLIIEYKDDNNEYINPELFKNMTDIIDNLIVSDIIKGYERFKDFLNDIKLTGIGKGENIVGEIISKNIFIQGERICNNGQEKYLVEISNNEVYSVGSFKKMMKYILKREENIIKKYLDDIKNYQDNENIQKVLAFINTQNIQTNIDISFVEIKQIEQEWMYIILKDGSEVIFSNGKEIKKGKNDIVKSVSLYNLLIKENGEIYNLKNGEIYPYFGYGIISQNINEFNKQSFNDFDIFNIHWWDKYKNDNYKYYNKIFITKKGEVIKEFNSFHYYEIIGDKYMYICTNIRGDHKNSIIYNLEENKIDKIKVGVDILEYELNFGENIIIRSYGKKVSIYDNLEYKNRPMDINFYLSEIKNILDFEGYELKISDDVIFNNYKLVKFDFIFIDNNKKEENNNIIKLNELLGITFNKSFSKKPLYYSDFIEIINSRKYEKLENILEEYGMEIKLVDFINGENLDITKYIKEYYIFEIDNKDNSDDFDFYNYYIGNIYEKGKLFKEKTLKEILFYVLLKEFSEYYKIEGEFAFISNKKFLLKGFLSTLKMGIGQRDSKNRDSSYDAEVEFLGEKIYDNSCDSDERYVDQMNNSMLEKTFNYIYNTITKDISSDKKINNL